MQDWMKKLAAVVLIGMALSGGLACAYGGVAATPDGSVIVTRNDLILFGLLRKIYTCKQAPTGLACTEVVSPP